VFKHKRPALVAVTLSAGFVQSRHGQTTGGFEDVMPMWIMALDAIHSAFHDRMMVGEVELGMSIQVALIANIRVFARIHDEFASSTTDGHVFAPGTVTRLTSSPARPFGIVTVKAGVRTGWKVPDDVAVTIGTGLITDESRPLN
jgi:hypothetical protein